MNPSTLPGRTGITARSTSPLRPPGSAAGRRGACLLRPAFLRSLVLLSALSSGLSGARPLAAAPSSPAPAAAPGDVDADVVRHSAEWFAEEAVVRAFGEAGVRLPQEAQRRINKTGTDYQILSETFFITHKTGRAEFLQKGAALLAERRAELEKQSGADGLARAREAAGGTLYRGWVFGNVVLVAVRTLGGSPEFQQAAGGQAWGPMSLLGQEINGRHPGPRGKPPEPQPDADWLKKWEADLRAGVFSKLPARQQGQIAGLLPKVLPDGPTTAPPAPAGPASTRPAPAPAVAGDAGAGKPVAGAGAVKEGEWVDVLKGMGAAPTALAGAWELADGTLTGSRGDRHARAGGGVPRLALPVAVTGGFEWEFTFNRTAGDKEFCLLFPAGRAAAMISLGGMGGQDSTIQGARDSTVKEQRLFNGKDQTVRLTVMPQGEDVTIEMLLDGKPYLSYKGPQAPLAPRPGYAVSETGSGSIGLAVHHASTVRFKDMRLRATTGTVRAARG